MPTNDSPLVPVMSDEDVAREFLAGKTLHDAVGQLAQDAAEEMLAAISARHTAARTAELRKDVEYWQHVAGDAQIKAKELEARTGKLENILRRILENPEARIGGHIRAEARAALGGSE